MRLQERGLAVPSYTRLNDKFSLRVSITNHRSTRQDFDFLVEKLVEIAKEVLEGSIKAMAASSTRRG